MIASPLAYAAQRRLAQHYVTRVQAANQGLLQGKENRLHWMRLISQDWEQIERCYHWSASGAPDDPQRLRYTIDLIDKSIFLLKARLAPAEYIAWMEHALAAARRLPDPSGERLALFRLADMYLATEKNDSAEPAARQLAALAEGAGDARSLGRAWYILGSVCSNRGAYDDAERWLHRSLEQLEGCTDADEDLAVVWLYLGRLAVYRGDYRRALDGHYKYLHMMEKLGLEGGVASVLISISGLNLFLGDPRTAEQHARRAVETARALGFRRMLPNAIISLAHAEKALGKLDAACAHYEEALGEWRPWLHPSSLINALYGLAQARYRQGDSARALLHDQEAVALARQAGMPFRLCEVAVDLALLHTMRAELPQARASLREALAAAERLATPRYWMMALGAAAVVWQRGGESEQAALWAGAVAQRAEYIEHMGVFRQACALLEAELGAERYQQLVERGKTLALDEQTRLALKLLENEGPP